MPRITIALEPEFERVSQLVLATLPARERVRGQDAMVDLRPDPPDDGLEPIRLVEGGEYRYEVHTSATQVSFQPSEVFVPDDETGKTGRLRIGLTTGRMPIEVAGDGVHLGSTAFEIQSTKLDYVSDYRLMMDDIARLATELALERFATSEQRLSPSFSTDPRSLYARFALLKGLLDSDRLRVALRRVLEQPYLSWAEASEVRAASRGGAAGSSWSRAATRCGSRVPWADSPVPSLTSLPRMVEIPRTEATHDNVPNRFVKFALHEWISLIRSVHTALQTETASSEPSAPIRRGLQETDRLLSRLEEAVMHPTFAGVGTLGEFPGSNQALQRNSAYRELFEAYVLCQFGAELAWSEADDVFGAGQRDVATLYEFWVFLELARIVNRICGRRFDMSTLIREGRGSLSLSLRRGTSTHLQGEVSRRGRTYEVTLFFNKSFPRNSRAREQDETSWSRAFRPDCSVRLRQIGLHETPAPPAWIHFDAKYRVDSTPTGDAAIRAAEADDLVKMHVYRDGIYWSSGAYVLFPGDSHQEFARHREKLPGIGAFPLRPGDEYGAERVENFLLSVIDQFAAQTSQHERGRFWERRVYGEDPLQSRVDASDELAAPPADTVVLLGYVKHDPRHLRWISENGLYNLRADARRGSVSLRGKELGAEFIVLYGGALGDRVQLWRCTGETLIVTATSMIQRGYPDPGGEVYLCLRIEPVDAPPAWLTAAVVNSFLRASGGVRGGPIAVTWSDLVRTESMLATT